MRAFHSVVIAVLCAVALSLLSCGPKDESSGGREAQSHSISALRAALIRRGEREMPTHPVNPLSGLGQKLSMPPQLRRLADSTLSGTDGMSLNFDASRFLKTSRGVAVWLVGGKAVTCIFTSDVSAGGCDTTARFMASGLSLGLGFSEDGALKRPSRFLLVAVSPAWARSARLRLGGRDEVVPVQRRTVVARAGQPVSLSGFARGTPSPESMSGAVPATP